MTWHNSLSRSTTKAPPATFCKIPLTVSVEPASLKSLISIDWILSSGVPAPLSCASGVLTLPSGDTLCSMNMKLSVVYEITYDLVLGRDWILFCRQTLPHASFSLSSGVFYPAQPRSLPFSVHPTAQDLDTQPQPHRDNNDTQPQDMPSLRSGRCAQYHSVHPLTKESTHITLRTLVIARCNATRSDDGRPTSYTRVAMRP
ncbi:hypothetical protein B0H19DRAFT_1063061 [Mycena capillaripes]|nr:hypothetical protein B0H19DRAFT_1063061 [Mycena capillaripes]